MQLSDKFRNLENDINSDDPTPTRLRDWLGTLCELCEDLAFKVEQVKASIADETE